MLKLPCSCSTAVPWHSALRMFGVLASDAGAACCVAPACATQHCKFEPPPCALAARAARPVRRGVDDDAPCYAVLLSVHERERAIQAAPAARLGPDGAPLPAKAKHSNRWVSICLPQLMTL